ncbi:GNAT family N-acetyltransferase [Ramlibacter alkalitolerans]|uniref:GNAT family N-acetyltransferase n=1 Tax=Ramlibacter alkalitolerans TaxID=2039631 RepID=A0ABS1JRD3_9BURK|nr:GNAT family N-acetyltransferase [Ramlibacter alkalitolerans]MBL0426768.1 GNAT family N-acetyltransferase [Ramlibacter alkalitolerans]
MSASPAPLQIRRAQAGDADVIAAFNCAMAQETEGKRLLPEVVGRGVRRLLAEPALGFYLVAVAGGEVVAALMVTTEWSDWRDGRFWWLQSVYVRPAWRRRGVFRALYAHVTAAAAQEPDVCGFRLYVERGNRAAQATYRALGLHGTDYLLLEQLRPGVVYLQAD